jgi:aminopeptidase N
MMEALATYSSLMFMEHRHGVETAQRTLRQFRARLLARNADGDTVESAGPIVLGERLRSSKFPTARLVILYEKGAWIVHMLRGILGDEKFIELLRNLPLKYHGEALTTADFQREAAALTPPDYPDPDLELFFETWVRGTGIPRWTVSFEQRDVKGGVELNGVLLQRDAPAYFSAVAPIAITTADGRVRTVYVVSQGEETEFSVRLDSRASSAAVDPSDQVLRRSQ